MATLRNTAFGLLATVALCNDLTDRVKSHIKENPRFIEPAKRRGESSGYTISVPPPAGYQSATLAYRESPLQSKSNLQLVVMRQYHERRPDVHIGVRIVDDRADGTPDRATAFSIERRRIDDDTYALRPSAPSPVALEPKHQAWYIAALEYVRQQAGQKP